jgi:hypothetical protein
MIMTGEKKINPKKCNTERSVTFSKCVHLGRYCHCGRTWSNLFKVLPVLLLVSRLLYFLATCPVIEPTTARATNMFLNPFPLVRNPSYNPNKQTKFNYYKAYTHYRALYYVADILFRI